MEEMVNLAEARKKLPELADRAHVGYAFILSRRGRELAVLMGIDEYRRLKAIEEGQRQKDFDILLAPPSNEALTEENAREVAVRMVREARAKWASQKP